MLAKNYLSVVRDLYARNSKITTPYIYKIQYYAGIAGIVFRLFMLFMGAAIFAL
jgi:hypothetical protein